MTMYVCAELSERVDLWGKQACASWVEYTPSAGETNESFFSFFNSLSFADVSLLFTATLTLFGVAYIFKQLPFFIRRR